MAQIALLESVIAQHAAMIQTQRIILSNMEGKQINRLAELRMQKLFLINAQRAAAKTTTP